MDHWWQLVENMTAGSKSLNPISFKIFLRIFSSFEIYINFVFFKFQKNKIVAAWRDVLSWNYEFSWGSPTVAASENKMHLSFLDCFLFAHVTFFCNLRSSKVENLKIIQLQRILSWNQSMQRSKLFFNTLNYGRGYSRIQKFAARFNILRSLVFGIFWFFTNYDCEILDRALKFWTGP